MTDEANIPEKSEEHLKYERLTGLMRHQGWKDVQEIITKTGMECLVKLCKGKHDTKDSDRLRGGLEVIEKIVSGINSDLKFGKVAKEAYIAQITKVTEE